MQLDCFCFYNKFFVVLVVGSLSPSSESKPQSSESLIDELSNLKERIPLDYKIKICDIHREHPNWKLPTIQKNGGSKLTRMDELTRWKKEIEEGGTVFDKYAAINKYTLEQFLESRKSKKPVYTRNLKVWAMQAAIPYLSDTFQFTASRTWLVNFKQNNCIRMRKVTRYVKPSENKSLEDLLQKAKDFQAECSLLLPKYNLDFVINTDQTGCEYRMNVQRTLTDKGAKIVEAYIGDLNKVSHSYTAQYSITASGKLVPKVYICLQEPKGSFGPVVQKSVDNMVKELKNVFVTCSKSGKLTSELVAIYLVNILKPYIKDDFVIILDSWGGQGERVLIEKLSEFGYKFEIKIIPAGCTPYAQPCDVYFFRQVKDFIKRIQNSTTVLTEDRQLNTRSDSIKIHSLIHQQLSAPIFQEMLQYAWYASKLIPQRKVFFTPSQVCFASEHLKNSCKTNDCKNICFIRCSWCRQYLCFKCFYDNYHPSNCSTYSFEPCT